MTSTRVPMAPRAYRAAGGLPAGAPGPRQLAILRPMATKAGPGKATKKGKSSSGRTTTHQPGQNRGERYTPPVPKAAKASPKWMGFVDHRAVRARGADHHPELRRRPAGRGQQLVAGRGHRRHLRRPAGRHPLPLTDPSRPRRAPAAAGQLAPGQSRGRDGPRCATSRQASSSSAPVSTPSRMRSHASPGSESPLLCSARIIRWARPMSRSTLRRS